MRNATGWIAVLVAALLATDQLSKLWVQNTMRLYSSIEVVSPLQLSYYINRGALGGLGWRSTLTIPILISGSLILILLLVLLYRLYGRLRTPSWRVNLFLALAITPLLSHSIDRVRQGYVVDFLRFGDSPVFNFADILPYMAIVVLGAELVAHIRSRSPRPRLVALGNGE